MREEVDSLIDPPLVRVVFTAGFSNAYTGGVREFQVRARNMRGVIKQMDILFPGLGEVLEEDTNVSVDGELQTGTGRGGVGANISKCGCIAGDGESGGS